MRRAAHYALIPFKDQSRRAFVTRTDEDGLPLQRSLGEDLCPKVSV